MDLLLLYYNIVCSQSTDLLYVNVTGALGPRIGHLERGRYVSLPLWTLEYVLQLSRVLKNRTYMGNADLFSLNVGLYCRSSLFRTASGSWLGCIV